MSSRNIFSVLSTTASTLGNAPALHQPLGKGKYRSFSWSEYRTAAEEIACGLRRLGVRKGENVALYSETRAEFYLADLGIMASGAVAAALYTSYPVTELIGNLRATGAHWIFVENPKSMAALTGAAGDRNLDAHFILLSGQEGGTLTLDGVRALGRKAMAEEPGFFERINGEVKPEDPAILYLTSGATGEPKMGLVTHGALVSNVDCGPIVLKLTHKDSTLVFLPSAHIAQRVVLELVPIRLGVEVWFSESLTKLPGEMKSIRPTFFLAPPRVWERMFASINTEIKKRGAISRTIFHGALGIGAEAAKLRQEGKPIPGWMRTPLKLADRLVFSKIRERLGGRLRIAASGAAPLGKELGEFFAAIGMPLIEGYGLTEGGVVTLNPLERPKPGSIGKPMPGIEVRLAEDGELLVKSPSLFSGYYNDPEATAAVLRDGWLYTGDIAEMDDEGYLYITGRKKELIVSSNGKKIYPARVESLFKTDPVINQVVLIGDKLPYVTALITINASHAENLKGMDDWKGKKPEEIAGAPAVHEHVGETVSRVNKQLAQFEQIRKFHVLERDFTIETGEVTPTMKIRRGKVLENYRDVVSELYVGKEESH